MIEFFKSSSDMFDDSRPIPKNKKYETIEWDKMEIGQSFAMHESTMSLAMIRMYASKASVKLHKRFRVKKRPDGWCEVGRVE